MCDGLGRAQKTTDKIAMGGLPALLDTTPTVTVGRGDPCQGCRETIAPHEKQYTVDLLKALTFVFHAECYETWRSFKT